MRQLLGMRARRLSRYAYVPCASITLRVILNAPPKETLRRLLKRAQGVMAAYLSNESPPAHTPHQCGASSSAHDELAVLGGRRSVITSGVLSSTVPPKPNFSSSSRNRFDTATYVGSDSSHVLGGSEQVETVHNYHAHYEEPVLNYFYSDPEQPDAHLHDPHHQEPPPPQNLNDIWGSYMSSLMAPPDPS